MIPNSSGPPASRPLRVAPIIPAIPRNFEKKARNRHQPPTSESFQQNPGATQQETSQPEDPISEAGQDLQIEISGDLNSKDDIVDVGYHGLGDHVVSSFQHPQHSKPFPKPPSSAYRESSPPSNQHEERANHGIQQSTPFQLRRAPSPAISRQGATHTHQRAPEPQASANADAEGGRKNGREDHPQPSPLDRVTTSGTEALSNTQNSYPDNNPSSNPSIYEGCRSPRFPSCQPSHPLPHDTLRYPKLASEYSPAYQRHHSQYHVTCPSSNVLSSSTPSVDQTQAYGSTYNYRHTSPSHHGPQEHHDIDRRSYYGQPPPMHPMGNAPYYVPSTTTHASLLQNWDSNEHQQGTVLDEHQEPSAFPPPNEVRHPAHYNSTKINGVHLLSPLPHFNNSQRDRSAIGQFALPMSSCRASTSNCSLASHVLENFNVPTFADCRLLATHEYDKCPPIRFLLHSLLLAQSPRLRNLLANGHYSYDFDGLKSVHLRLCDRFITPVSLEAALQVCYGAPVASFTGSNPKSHLPKTKADFSACWMKESLAFSAAGVFLQLNDVVLRGLEIAGRIINWDNLEHAMSFALEGARHRKHSPSASVIPHDPPQPSYNSDTSTINTVFTPNTSQSSTDMSLDFKGHDIASPPMPGPSASTVSCADDLLFRCLHFLASHLPESWTFDVTARPLAHIDRLPVTAESRSPLSKSRLSKIQFGELPAEMATKASDHDTFVSSIVLSLPFSALKALILMEGRVIKHHLQQIIEERERRRFIVLRSHSVSSAQREEARHYGWIEVGYKEYLDVVDEETSIARKLVGIHGDSLETATQEHQNT